jgi:pimeloyl-ACP methyl ester carboxylesterase
MDDAGRQRLVRTAGNPSVKRALWVNRHHWRVFTASRSEPAVSVPFVLVGGDGDPLGAKKDLEEMSGVIAGSRTVMLDGVHHSAPVEAPGDVAELIISLFTSDESPR